MFFKLIIVLLFVIYLFNKDIKETFENCIEYAYNNNLQVFKNNPAKMSLGYNPNDYIYKTLLMVSDDPLPVNANFFNNKY